MSDIPQTRGPADPLHDVTSHCLQYVRSRYREAGLSPLDMLSLVAAIVGAHADDLDEIDTMVEWLREAAKGIHRDMLMEPRRTIS